MNSDSYDGDIGSFLGEAEELVASMYETIGTLGRGSAPRPSDVNALFRATHTLKGLAGMLDFQALQALSHGLEDLLGALRLGKMAWSPAILEVVSEGIDHLRESVEALSTGSTASLDFGPFLAAIERTLEDGGQGAGAPAVDLPEEVRRTLTEYEEARLAACLGSGQQVLELTFQIAFTEFASVGKELSETLEASGEIITKLPAPGSPGGTEQRFLYLFATADAAIEEALPDLFGSRLLSVRSVAAPGAPEVSAAAATREDTADEGDPGLSAERSRGATASVRIEIATLDALTTLVGALFAERSRLHEIGRRLRDLDGPTTEVQALDASIQTLEKRVSELQRALMTVRLVPIGQIWNRLRRIVAGYTRSSGKRIRLALDGGDTKLDKVIVEKLVDPLIHLIRNAMDHGIEPPGDRRTLGKPEEGLVALVAAPRGSQIQVTVKDDGRGIPWERVRARAAERGLLADPDRATIDDLTGVLFLPGFSTASAVTDVSGRGVGMDVVKKNLADVNAFVDVRSSEGKGTEITVTLPITLAIFQALLCEVQERLFAIPLSSVLENLRIETGRLPTLSGKAVIPHRGQEIPVRELARLLRLPSSDDRGANGHRYVVVVGSAERRLALVVDRIRGQREIVTRPLGRLLAKVPGIAGGAVVGERSLALVLDVGSLAAERDL